jgi:ATP-dependent DNA helicase DinG
MLTIDGFFDDNGPLASVLGSYRRRDEQVGLARSVADTLRGGGVLLGDAPPGTGKSMAYLAPVALGMREFGGDVLGKAVVSTATKALQHQLVAKDLPTLAGFCEEAGIRVPTFALLKGRGEFLYDRRMDG